MNDDKNISTRDRILLCTEKAYAESGVDGMTVRGVTETARVNLAAINYHFQSKQTLVEAMLWRILSPLAEAHIALLSAFETTYGPNIRPTHVMAALALPLLGTLKMHGERSEHSAVLLRCTGDQAPMVRNFLERKFHDLVQRFIDAFARSAPTLTQQDAVWRTRLFCNAMPGAIANQGLAQMCKGFLNTPEITAKKALFEFSYLAEAVMTGSASQPHVEYLVGTVFETLERTSVLRARPALKIMSGLDPEMSLSASKPASGHDDLRFSIGPAKNRSERIQPSHQPSQQPSHLQQTG